MLICLHNIYYKADHRLANWKLSVSGRVAGDCHPSTSFLSAVVLRANQPQCPQQLQQVVNGERR